MLWSTAFAQTAGAAQPGIFEQIVIPFLFVFLIFYVLILRPQSKRAKKQDEFITKLKRGDSVLTVSGILGTIEGIADKFVTLEIAEGVRIKILKSQIMSSINEEKQ